MEHHNKLHVGIDVSKQKLDVASSERTKVETFPYTKQGIKQLFSSLKKSPDAFICLEATGGWERALLCSLHENGFEVAVVNPRQIRNFARATNQLAKTDQIDARMIAQFAALMRPRPTPPLTVSQQKLRDFTARKRQVTKLIVQEKNRLATTFDKDIQKLIKQTIALFEKQLEAIRTQMQQLIDNDERAQAIARIIESVPGLGPATAATLIAEVPELGSLNRQQVARLIGVAPTNRDSGTMRGKRTTGGGRVTVRNALYMPTIVAVQHNPKIKEFYTRLVENGKPKLVALIAAMRKLLIILNVMIREQKTWKQNQQNA